MSTEGMLILLGIVILICWELVGNSGRVLGDDKIQVAGVVGEIQKFQCPWSGTHDDVHVMLNTGTGVIKVHLASPEYLDAIHWLLCRGDWITAVGRKIPSRPSNILIAEQVTCRSQTIVIRDAQGRCCISPVALP